MAVGLLAAWEAKRLGLGSVSDPGPGLWPMIVSVAVIVTAAIVTVRPGDDAESFDGSAGVVVLGALSLVAYAWLLPILGFEVPTIALLAFWIRGLGGDTWRTTAAVSVGTTAAVYLVFIVGLDVSIPHIAQI